jgi:hypothetical protein
MHGDRIVIDPTVRHGKPIIKGHPCSFEDDPRLTCSDMDIVKMQEIRSAEKLFPFNRKYPLKCQRSLQRDLLYRPI